MQVVTLKTRKGQTLIEWTDSNGIPRRSYVPAESVVEGEVKHPERGVPFGLDFAHFVGDVAIDTAAIDRELKLANIWTAEDFIKNYPVAIAAVNRGLGHVAQLILSKVQNAEQQPPEPE